MPVKECNNGKWRIGSGECIYDTKEKATKVWQAILAGGNYVADPKKISYDYDDTLNQDKIIENVLRHIKDGDIVYIISARGEKSGMLAKAKKLGIPESRVYATGSNKAKVEKIKQLGIGTHYDNNVDVIDQVRKLTDATGIQA